MSEQDSYLTRNMSLQANPLVYLNMGGEMLYVLRQRLKAQRIAIDKSVRVLDEVTTCLLDPHIISNLFERSTTVDLPAIRSNLEKAVLSSIMRLDETSMNKLFELMIMMVKFQFQMATGPRELLLLTLNHIDSMRDTLTDSSGHQSLVNVHRMLIQHYGNLTYEELWQVRQACLIKLDDYNVRVSILLRLDLQRENGSFVSPKIRVYNERYEDRREDLWNLRLLENSCQQCNVGSLQFVGDRVTNLGRNVYASSYDLDRSKTDNKFVYDDKNRVKRHSLVNSSPVGRAELGMLAVQLGSEDDGPSSVSSAKPQCRPFTLQLFANNSEVVRTIESIDQVSENRCEENEPIITVGPTSNNRYKAQLDNLYTDLIVEEEKNETSAVRTMELLDLMDQLE